MTFSPMPPSSVAEPAPPPDWLHPGASWLRRLWLYLWVVPRVQWDLFDLEYQLYTFDLFHHRALTKRIHYVTITMVMLSTLAFLAQWPLWPGAPRLANLGLAYALVVALVHLPWCWARRLAGLWVASALLLALLWAGGTAWYLATAIADAPWYASTMAPANPLLWIYGWALVETVSHSLEPVPPYTTGAGRWMSKAEFQAQGGRWLVLAGLATPTVFTLVSFASNPRTLPMVVLRLLGAAGYRRRTIEAIDAIVAAEWRSGQPRMHRVPTDARPERTS